jgi:hypothetical protein
VIAARHGEEDADHSGPSLTELEPRDAVEGHRGFTVRARSERGMDAEDDHVLSTRLARCDRERGGEIDRIRSVAAAHPDASHAAHRTIGAECGADRGGDRERSFARRIRAHHDEDLGGRIATRAEYADEYQKPPREQNGPSPRAHRANRTRRNPAPAFSRRGCAESMTVAP